MSKIKENEAQLNPKISSIMCSNEIFWQNLYATSMHYRY